MPKYIILPLLLAAGWLTAAVASVGDVRVEYIESWPAVEEGGCCPIIMTLQNTGKTESLFRVNGTSRSKVAFTRSVTLGPFETRLISIPVPDLFKGERYWQSYEIEISANRETRILPDLYRRKYGSNAGYSVLLAARKKPASMAVFENVFIASTGYSGGDSLGDIAPSWLPEGWISYSGIDFILADGAAVPLIATERGVDLTNWVHLGGVILFFNAEQIAPNDWRRVFPGLDVDRGEESCAFGRGKVCFIKGFPDTEDQWREIRSRLVADRRLSIAEQLNEPDFQIPGVGGIPAKGFLAIIVLFSIAIGPVNIFYFRVKRKDIYILATIPAMAISAGLFLYLYSNLAEGITAKAVTVSVTELVGTRNMAYTDAGFVVYNSSFTKKDFRLSADDLVVMRKRLLTSSARLDYRGGEIIGRSFVTQRVLQSFRVQSACSARERIAVTEENGALYAANGLGIPVRYIGVWSNGSYFAAEGLADGSKVKLSPATVPSMVELLSFGEGELNGPDSQDVANYLRPITEPAREKGKDRRFMAVTASNPFARPDLAAFSSVAAFHLVHGEY